MAISSVRLRESRLPRVCGHETHGRVPASHWCVSRRDLQKLRIAVKTAVEQGHIHPTVEDMFDPLENVYGPCIHIVVSQMIKPICYSSGGSSWALLQHPHGLKCDVFVSHCWDEGLYEFIDKVLHSWPAFAENAYCCMLSNPQTLDMGKFIANPSESPFAQALAASTHVLVVPNRKCSIYCRAWCTYEAFLAHEWKKSIIVASSPIRNKTRSMAPVYLCWLFSILLHVFMAMWKFEDKIHHGDLYSIVLATGFHTCVVFSMVLRSGRLLLFSNIVGAYSVAGVHVFWVQSQFSYIHNLPMSEAVTKVCVTLVVSISEQSFFAFAQSDSLKDARKVEEQKNLERGYSGHVRNSQASVPSDKDRILQEIRDADVESRVDETIEVLLKSGMSSPALQIAHKKGVDIAAAGEVRLKFCAIGLQAWFNAFRCFILFERKYAHFVMLLLSVAFGLVCFVRNWPWPDKRALSLVVLWKVVGIPFYMSRISYWTLFLALRAGAPLTRAQLNIVLQCWTYSCPYLSLIACTLATFNLGVIASIPLVGVTLAQFLVNTNIRFPCTNCWHGQRQETDFSSDIDVELARLPSKSRNSLVECG